MILFFYLYMISAWFIFFLQLSYKVQLINQSI